MATVAGELEARRKPGIYEERDTLVVVGDEYILRVANALSSPTRLKILKLLLRTEADVGEIAELLGQSKANASAQIRRLEEAGLVQTEYKPGSRGVRKICKAPYRRILLVLEPGEE
ncbi:transcriptional regulator, ArsR family [Pyrolobus fumarii 1A]|uniref:Transcriptional regulator, ArsR family n=1 Tax=Pyrolobus fumarii (strain DSM 11204 / 1A) TaxID=694429 RepID=G0EDI2_PYRF1|nr:metalloregulator ArsR/SmtB family transcription factor [Pyrolobus fumarii]AEM38667.1 transcriptional regulator, ArsR family [Pyrolobus fumarii 1A]